MKAGLRAGLVVFASALFVLSVCGLLVLPAVADSSLVWEGDVYSSGVEVTSAVLNYGAAYRVVATQVWYYSVEENTYLAADAMYYTTDSSDTVYWGNYFPVPGGGSFLQINGQNVSWGTFSNGGSGDHTYTTYCTGTGVELTFRIVHWAGPSYGPISCHLHVQIYSEFPAGGRIADVVPSGLIVGFVVGAVAFASVVTVPMVVRRRRA